MSASVRVLLLAPLHHHGRDRAKGEEIDVDPSTAQQLVAAGMVSLVPETPPLPKPVKPVAPAASPKGREA